MTRRQEGSERTDDLIIAILSQNARASNTEVAQKLNMSESAVRRRISNLLSTGRIRKFTVEVDDQHMSSAITWVSVSPSVPTNSVSSRIKQVSGVETVYETAGQFDVAAIIKGANIVEVNKTVEGIRRVEGVINTNTMMVLRAIR
ncbi:MAG TPA: Lrp/AsnC family transcriptional regulator [Nitrososphaerales archaeon]|nr:Lrp/AsnC family transcriptional regulator [Nitrososphaerales archaeon]